MIRRSFSILVMTMVLMAAAAFIGLQRGHAACAAATGVGANGNWSAPPDPACGTTSLLGGTYTNYCVLQTCNAQSVGCSGSTSCYVKTCAGGSSRLCHVYSPTFSAHDCYACSCP